MAKLNIRRGDVLVIVGKARRTPGSSETTVAVDVPGDDFTVVPIKAVESIRSRPEWEVGDDVIFAERGSDQPTLYGIVRGLFGSAAWVECDDSLLTIPVQFLSPAPIPEESMQVEFIPPMPMPDKATQDAIDDNIAF